MVKLATVNCVFIAGRTVDHPDHHATQHLNAEAPSRDRYPVDVDGPASASRGGRHRDPSITTTPAGCLSLTMLVLLSIDSPNE